MGLGVSTGAVDFAKARYRASWLSHPVLGEPSWDAMVRSSANPIYVGQAPYEWPVNGFLFCDPRGGDWFAHVSLYPRGYWPAGPSRLLRSGDAGKTWEDLGLALRGGKDSFDGDGRVGGATLDATAVVDADGCHVVYGWAKPDNSDGGIAYAWGPTAAGPFTRDREPIHAESRQPLLAPGYKRVYASTLVRRRNDWLILADMSTPGNAGGMWAFVALTAPDARGPYSGPVFLRRPQDETWFPQPIEFATAFVHGGWVYAPFTSVAANRGWQLLMRARVEDAHRPEAWEVFQAGSLWHWEGAASEAKGIWGQTFSGFVDARGRWNLMFPAKDAGDVGTMHLASRRWRERFHDGFWVSAPVAPSLALLGRDFADFDLHIEAKAKGAGAWSVVWDVRAPLTSDRPQADGRMAARSTNELTALCVTGREWRLESRPAAGGVQVLGGGPIFCPPMNRASMEGVGSSTPPAGGLPGRRDGAESSMKLRVIRRSGSVVLAFDGGGGTRLGVPAGSGGIGVLAEPGCALQVTRFEVSGSAEPASRFLLAEDGLLGAGWTGAGWRVASEGFRFGHGYVGDFDGARAKWSVAGRRIRVWSPRGPAAGEVEWVLDGRQRGRIDLRHPASTDSAVVWDSGVLAKGLHVLSVRRVSGAMAVDAVEVSDW